MSHFNGTLMIFYIFFQYINSKERVFFYNKGIEVDFYVPDDGLAVQVSYSIDNPVTLEREVRAIRKHSTTSNTALPRMSSDEDAMTASNFPGSTTQEWLAGSKKHRLSLPMVKDTVAVSPGSRLTLRNPLSSFTGRGKEDFRGERQLPGRVGVS